ncbi:hypothetical protein [Myceligenerans pegani]|uniref:DUF3592 domain-containing protein n=1 Tax=Myceligenerans pegani TaxID=2776917 RepID=A0ABR9N4H0_9MICO|nr:hypothetical protein [Myceligenerans sp. TRM 65318]MBE1877973.1 hypothetical protein [Myceligenerans sp. TRM 65318]MBE3020244.1 hypothetical protein [Myceligenerans sp. TRM 65318]
MASRTLGRFLGDTWGTRIIRLLFTIGAVLTVASLALIPAALGQAGAAEDLLSDGARATATGAEGRAEVRERLRDGMDRREVMDPEVRATVALPDGSQQLTLNDPEGAPETAYQENWAPAPAPYEGSFEVAYDPSDPAGTVMAVTDAEEKAGYTPVGNVVLAVFFLVWTLAFAYPFYRTFKKQTEPAQA